MKQQVSPKLFFAVIALVCLAVGTLLYRQATDPLYHNEPDEEMARRQFSKPAAASASAPEKGAVASKPNAKSETGRKSNAASSPGP